MRLIFLGPPGSGKGTQAERISDDLGLVHLSTGEMLREEVRQGTELGRRIRSIMEAGELVKDEIVNSMVFHRIEELQGFLLDGYPRNLKQAEELDRFAARAGRSMTGVVLLDVPDDEVVRRISGRLTCPECGYVGSTSDHGPGQPCPECGADLVGREDDTPTAVRKRLENYHAQTSPLIRHYEDLLVRVEGVGSVDEVTERIERALRNLEEATE